MTTSGHDLLSLRWGQLDAAELMTLVRAGIDGPGQYPGAGERNKFCLPLAGIDCRVQLEFRRGRIVAITQGPSFDRDQWDVLSDQIDQSTPGAGRVFGRAFTFCSFRVDAGWRGLESGVSLLPPPSGTPEADQEIAAHPFILEYPLHSSPVSELTMFRRAREHQRISRLLNLLLNGRTSEKPSVSENGVWISTHQEGNPPDFRWVRPTFWASLGSAISNDRSALPANRIVECSPAEYYLRMGHDGLPLRVPSDLDTSIKTYQDLGDNLRRKFDRCLFWIDFAAATWGISTSSSFAALVSAIESLTGRDSSLQERCAECGRTKEASGGGPTAKFQNFLETYASGSVFDSRRKEMYRLRSNILHGSSLMIPDYDLAFRWDPWQWNEHELHSGLWSLARIASLNWLGEKRDPSSRAGV